MNLSMRSSRSLLSLIALFHSACDPFHTEFAAEESARMYRARSLQPTDSSPTSLSVMTWNIKFGGARIRFFFECGGKRANMAPAEVLENLRGIAEKIEQSQPDLLLLQEVDVESTRSAYIDAVQWLLDHTYFNYGAYASQWKADFIPSDGLGRMNSGNALLSRWPLEEGTRLALPLIGDQSGLTRYFFLKRNVLRVRLSPTENETLWVFATHFSAFAEDDTKLRQAERLLEFLDPIQQRGERLIVGGDLNLLPPGSETVVGFPEDCEDGRFDPDDYSGQENWLDALYLRYAPAISLNDYQNDNRPYFTFSGDERFFWNRKLDYLFSNESFVPGSDLVHQDVSQGGLETILRSDHAPLSATLTLP